MLKKSLFLLALACLSTSSSLAQEQAGKKMENVKSSWYLAPKVGLHSTKVGFDNTSLLYGVDLGYHFNPVVGARLNVNGMGDDFKCVTSNLDLHLNLFNIFSKNRVFRPFNVYLLGGVGLNYSWDKARYDELLDHNFRVGAMLEYRPIKHLGVMLEVDFDNRSSKYLPTAGDLSNNRWVMNTMVGLTWNFAHKYGKTVEEVQSSTANLTALSLYEQMQAKVSERMTGWMKRAKGETKADYQRRTSPEAIESMRLQLEEEVSTEMAGDLINQSGAKFGRYSRRNNLATIEFDQIPSIVVGMSKDKMMATKANGPLKFRNTKYRITPDNEYEIVYTEIEAEGVGYSYDNTTNDAPVAVASADFMPLGVVQQTINNEVRLESIKEHALKQARNENIINDNVIINVAAEVIPAENDHYDYKITYRYDVKDEFSVDKDFAPGKYNAEKSNASVAMMNIIKEAFATDFAQYVQPGKRCDISLTGTADAMPIHNKVVYNGEYGDVITEDVYLAGKNTTLSVNKKDGIRSNEELSLVRAVSVKNFIDNNVPNLKNMKVKHDYTIEVGEEEGAKYRRVKVVFYFYDAF